MLPPWILFPEITKHWTEIQSVNDVFLLSFTNLASAICYYLLLYQVCLRRQGISISFPNQILDLGWDLKLPYRLPQRFQILRVRRSTLLILELILQKTIPRFHQVHSSQVMRSSQCIMLLGPAQWDELNFFSFKFQERIVQHFLPPQMSFRIYKETQLSLCILSPTRGQDSCSNFSRQPVVSHTRIECPSPILHVASLLMTSLPLMILFQAQDAELGFLAFITEHCGKYLALKNKEYV